MAESYAKRRSSLDLLLLPSHNLGGALTICSIFFYGYAHASIK
jgi:hypothetical protein